MIVNLKVAFILKKRDAICGNYVRRLRKEVGRITEQRTGFKYSVTRIQNARMNVDYKMPSKVR